MLTSGMAVEESPIAITRDTELLLRLLLGMLVWLGKWSIAAPWSDCSCHDECGRRVVSDETVGKAEERTAVATLATERPAHDFNRCICKQWGRCLVHCATCHCGEPGRHLYDFTAHWWKWVPE